MRKLCVAVLLVISLMVVSCGKAPGSSEIIGKWKCAALRDRTIEFRQDGTLTMQESNMTQEGTYQLKGSQLEIKFQSLSEPSIWKVSSSGGNLIIAIGAGRNYEKFTFERVK